MGEIWATTSEVPSAADYGLQSLWITWGQSGDATPRFPHRPVDSAVDNQSTSAENPRKLGAKHVPWSIELCG